RLLSLLSIRQLPTPTIFPYTTLFRSHPADDRALPGVAEMSFIKSSITDTCPHCGGSGEINTPISIPTSNPNYPGYAYDEHTEPRSEEHTSELQSRENLVCRLLLEKKN